jgi:hypothetical protein
MKKLTGLLHVSDAVLIAKDGSDLTVQTWRDREPGFSARMIHRDEEPDQLLGPLAPPAMKIEKRVEPRVEPLPVVHEKRWYQKNWVRASIAGGVILGVIGSIVYAQRDQTLPPLNMNPQWDK